MILPEIKGAIFDVDDTLLDNRSASLVNLHERSHQAAIQAVGRRLSIKALANISMEETKQAFHRSSVHFVEAAVWVTLQQNGLVNGEIVDSNHPLVREITDLKDKLHIGILKTEGREVPGATRFVELLVARGLGGRLAIASGAPLQEITTFLEMFDLRRYFADRQIISKELVTHPKPDPEAFDRAFVSLNLPEACRVNVLAFEDDPRGIASAQAAGLIACTITTRYSAGYFKSLKQPPCVVADSFAEFEERLGLLPGVGG